MTALKRIVCCGLALLGGAGLARADLPALSKEFQDYMLAHHYVAVGLDRGSGLNVQTIPVKINGQDVTLMVDCGCGTSLLSARCASQLHLDVKDTGKSEYGVGGEIAGHMGVAAIQSLALKTGEINRLSTIRVLPKSAALDREVDGVFGLDLLGLNAAIFPVGGSGVLLKPGPAPWVDITGYMTRFGFKAAPMSESQGHLWMDGHINGRPMHWMVDSGASLSSFRVDAVEAALGRKLERTRLVGFGFDGRLQTTFDFTPTSMDIGGCSIPPHLLLAAGPALFHREKFDGLLGVDVMGEHLAVIDLRRKTLWIK